MYSSVSVIIDASNVCWEVASRPAKESARSRPPLRGLVQAVNYFEPYREREAVILAVAPAWWDRCGEMAPEDDQTAYESLCKEGILVLAPEKTHDDLFILGCAWRDGKVIIVSNDMFRDHQVNLGLNQEWYEERRVGFCFENDNFLPQHEKIERILGSIGVVNLSLPDEAAFKIPEMWEPPSISSERLVAKIYREEIPIEDTSVIGRMIGKEGNRIKAIQKKYGADIQVKDNSKVTISALTPERVCWARIDFFAVPTIRPKAFQVPSSRMPNLENKNAPITSHLMEIEEPTPSATTSRKPVEKAKPSAMNWADLEDEMEAEPIKLVESLPEPNLSSPKNNPPQQPLLPTKNNRDQPTSNVIHLAPLDFGKTKRSPPQQEPTFVSIQDIAPVDFKTSKSISTSASFNIAPLDFGKSKKPTPVPTSQPVVSNSEQKESKSNASSLSINLAPLDLGRKKQDNAKN